MYDFIISIKVHKKFPKFAAVSASICVAESLLSINSSHGCDNKESDVYDGLFL